MICQTAEGILRKKLRVSIDKRDEIYTIKKDFNNLWEIMIYESNSGNCQKSSAGNDRHDGYQIKETLFNIISRELPDCTFLDLFSGSGAIAIEALSRGAKQAVLVEQNRKAVDCINRNLEFTKLKDKARVITGDCVAAIDSLERSGLVFDIIFMDPPYGKLLEKQVLNRLASSGIVDKNTWIIVESDLDTEYDYLTDIGYEIDRVKKYKTNKHTFIQEIL
jgi:16S rRNA (guanine966-N2)-methyltransferase